ncbi:hypothetical protein BGZ83_009204 [Gryganskiella cystojenkinii]|nr:hypothetical protein BGZ83_009204 [Gryganskiella cystojenkinii]
MYRAFTAFVVATLFLAQFGSATTGDLVISGEHHRNPSGYFTVFSSNALIVNDTPVQATAYSDKDCKGTTTPLPAGFTGTFKFIQSVQIA